MRFRCSKCSSHQKCSCSAAAPVAVMRFSLRSREARLTFAREVTHRTS